MFSFHKPKIYRSITGCCICRAKSSSSRFTDSVKYETEFEKCFRIKEKRDGEICNACVLLVKRWKKLPSGTNRHWHHVVDARAGPGTKSTLKIKNKISPSKHKYKSPLKSRKHFQSIPSPNFFDDLSINEDSSDKPYAYSNSPCDSEEDSDNDDAENGNHRHRKKKTGDSRISSFLDLSYWKKTQVCCGIIFKGLNGEVLVDPKLLRPCWSCRKTKIVEEKSSLDLQSQSNDDTDSSCSNSGYPENEDSEFLEPIDPDSPPMADSPALSLMADSPALTLMTIQCNDNKLKPFPTQRELAMEC